MTETAKQECPVALNEAESLIDKIKKRQTPELVIALCGAIGSGTTQVATEIQSKLESCKFEVNIIHASDIIKELSNFPQIQKDFTAINKLQDAGNLIRKNYGNDYLAQCLIKIICEKRWEKIKDLPEAERHGCIRN